MIIAAVLAAIQGLSMSLTLEGAPSSMQGVVSNAGWEFRALIAATVVGGVMTSVFVARVITAQRLANGYVVLVAATSARDFVLGIAHHAQPSFRDISIALASCAVVAVATLRCIAASRAPGVSVKGGDDPYRAVRSILVHPVIPVPTGSIQPYLASMWLLFALSELPSQLNLTGAVAPERGCAARAHGDGHVAAQRRVRSRDASAERA